MINSKGKRLMPIYLIKFLLSIYDGLEVPNFGARMVSRSFIAYVDSLYKLFGGKNPTDYGRRLVPEYLIKWIEDADFIEFIDDEIAYTKEVPLKALNFAFVNEVGGMCYKIEDSLGNFEIEETKVTSIISKDSSNNIIDTIAIPSEVQLLEGYGWGVNENFYNYIDYEAKKFKKIVGKYTFTGNESWQFVSEGNRVIITTNSTSIGAIGTTNGISDTDLNFVVNNYVNNGIYIASANVLTIFVRKYGVITDVTTAKEYLVGKTIYYELATPVETDISSYIDNNLIKVSPSGTITFNNQYDQPVPSIVSFIVPSGE